MWSVADQGASSLGNVILTLAVARVVQPRDLGAFSIAYVSYFLGLGVMRGLCLDPLLVGLDEQGAGGGSQAAGCAVALSLLYALMLFGVALVTHGALREAFLALSISTPCLFLQDACRYLLFSERRPAAAAANDSMWLVLQLGGFAILQAHHTQSIESLTLVWGATAGLCAAGGLVQSRTHPLVSRWWTWIRTNRGLGLPFATEFVVYSGSGQLALLLVGAFAGLADLGALRASMALFGPLQVIAVGLNIAVMAEGARLLRTSPRSFKRLLVFYSAGLAGLGVVFGLLLAMVPLDWGTALVGASWTRVHELIPSMTAFVALWTASAAPAAGLRVLRDAKRGLRARAISCALLIALAAPGAALWGVNGAVWSFAVAQAVGLVLWWWKLERSYLDHPLEVSLDSGAWEAPPADLFDVHGEDRP